MSEIQEHIILTTTYDIILALDNDRAGIKCTKQIINKLKDKINISIANIPINKDVGELNETEILLSISNKLSVKEWVKKYGI
jgi:DNA primase